MKWYEDIANWLLLVGTLIWSAAALLACYWFEGAYK